MYMNNRSSHKAFESTKMNLFLHQSVPSAELLGYCMQQAAKPINLSDNRISIIGGIYRYSERGKGFANAVNISTLHKTTCVSKSIWMRIAFLEKLRKWIAPAQQQPGGLSPSGSPLLRTFRVCSQIIVWNLFPCTASSFHAVGAKCEARGFLAKSFTELILTTFEEAIALPAEETLNKEILLTQSLEFEHPCSFLASPSNSCGAYFVFCFAQIDSRR